MTNNYQGDNSPGRPCRTLGAAIGGIGIFLALLFLAGCDVLHEKSAGESSAGSGAPAATAHNANTLTIVSWNVQALFDGDETGIEYDEYLESAGWITEKYKARLNSFSRALGQIAANVPDVLALQETENSRVLEELAGSMPSKYGYRWTFFANNPGSALGIGVLSRFPFEETRVHSITRNGETIPRPILEVWLRPRDNPLVLFICHWKSKLSGDIATESLRRASARIIIRRIQEIQKEHKDMPMVIMGDLNENHDEFYRQAGSILSTLLPDDPKVAELTGIARDREETGGPQQNTQGDFFVLSKKKPPLSGYFPSGAPVFYSPWGNELQDGSYYYRNAWETIDHFLLNESLFDAGGWEFDSSLVIKKEPFVNSGGYPNAYNPRTGNGLSDHLPLMLILRDG